MLRNQLIRTIFKNKKTIEQLKSNLGLNESVWERVVNSWRRTTKKLSNLGSHSIGNSVQVFNNGDDTFSSMWEDIQNAKSSILLETYTIEMDDIGKKTISLLEDAKRRGCSVTFVYDAIGSSSVTENDLFRLTSLGAKTYQFNPISILGRLPFVFRNHRKIMVIDDKIGYCGGMNISSKYATEKIGGNGYFRDTHVRIEGPAVLDLKRVFHNSIKDKHLVLSRNTYENYSPAKMAACHYDQTPLENLISTVSNLEHHVYQRNLTDKVFKIDNNNYIYSSPSLSEKPANKVGYEIHSPKSLQSSIITPIDGVHRVVAEDEDTFEYEEDEDEDESEDSEVSEDPDEEDLSFVQVQESNLFRNKSSIQRAMIVTLRNAKSHCYFTTPYFLPPRKLRRAMVDASNRGVDVRVITAGVSDVPWVRLASRHIYNKFLKNGVKIYELIGPTRLHSKTVTIDGIYCSVGSYNLDPWSQRNLEVNLSFINSRVAKLFEDQFANDLLDSSSITILDMQNRSIFEKVFSYLAYQFSKIVRPVSYFA